MLAFALGVLAAAAIVAAFAVGRRTAAEEARRGFRESLERIGQLQAAKASAELEVQRLSAMNHGLRSEHDRELSRIRSSAALHASEQVEAAKVEARREATAEFVDRLREFAEELAEEEAEEESSD